MIPGFKLARAWTQGPRLLREPLFCLFGRFLSLFALKPHFSFATPGNRAIDILIAE